MSDLVEAWIIEYEDDWCLRIDTPDGAVNRTIPFTPANLTKLVAFAYAWFNARGLPLVLKINENRKEDK